MVRKYESLASESATLHAYLREIATFPSLTRDDEQELGRLIHEHGDQVALGRLVQANLQMVVGYAKRFRRLGVPLLDLIHEGNLGLIEAARRFDPAGAEFQASALWWIRQAVMHLLSEAGRTENPTTSGLLAATVQGRQIDAIRVALEYAQSAAAGQEIKEPPVADEEDFAAHLQDKGRRKTLRKARKRGQAAAGDLHVIRQHSVLLGYLN
ncbi:MAG TPA: sigma-70 family RNA polymerase sigma factor [Vicinamibacterales bacterium]|nr:sigma-70 family RNA polymerase sigma factor [Vicinamibacterales bacterium]